MSLATVPPRLAAPLATAGAVMLSLAASLATPLGAQDTLRPPAGAPVAAVGHGSSAPAVRVSLGDEALVPGEHGRVSVRTRADGYAVVLQADPTGRVRVLFPLDPDDSAQAVRADADLVVRSRGGGRDAFTAGSSSGDGTVLAAFSADRPFRAGRYARNGHWDPRAFPRVANTADAEGELLAIVGELLPRGARFDYDVATYRVHEPLPVVATAPAGDGYAPESAATAEGNAYDGAATMPTGGYFYDPLYDGYLGGGYFNGFYGGIFPVVVVVPTSFFGSSRRHGFHSVGFDPFSLTLGCPPVFFSPFARLPRFGGPGLRPGHGAGRDGYGVVYSGPRAKGPYLYGSTPPAAAASTPASYRNRQAARTGTGPTIWRTRSDTPPAQSGATPEASPPPPASGWTPMTWHSITAERRPAAPPPNGGQREAIPVWRGSAPRAAPPASRSAPAPSAQPNGGGGPAIWRTPAHASPAAGTAHSSAGAGARGRNR